MNIDDFIIPPREYRTEEWQLGHIISNELKENSIALIFVSDYRGAGGEAEVSTFHNVRKILYRLSRYDFEIPICDLGNLISGKSLQDTHYILQEVISSCLYKGSIPVVIGGGVDLSYAMFSAVNFHQKNNSYTHISNILSLVDSGGDVNEYNFLSRIFSTKSFSLLNFHFLGYQKHLNELNSVKLIKDVEFDILRLADMMNNTGRMEPFFRKADLVTVNCDAIESVGEPFSVHPQVNGLNNREACAYMKEAGLSEVLKGVGIFNFNINSDNGLHHQLLAQMIWYLMEGINIQKSHPVERNFETFIVLVDEVEYIFKRDTFSDLWYYGDDDDIRHCVPCAREDYEDAKRGILNKRFFR